MCLPMKKKGYFFTVDAFISMGVLAIGLLLIISFRSGVPPTLQTSIYSNDITNLFASTSLYELNNRYIDELRQDGNITNTRYTIMEQLGEFLYRNETDLARNLIINLSSGTLIQAFSFSIHMDNHTLYNSSDTQGMASDLVSSKKIVNGIYNQTLWGPYLSEVRVWR